MPTYYIPSVLDESEYTCSLYDCNNLQSAINEVDGESAVVVKLTDDHGTWQAEVVWQSQELIFGYQTTILVRYLDDEFECGEMMTRTDAEDAIHSLPHGGLNIIDGPHDSVRYVPGREIYDNLADWQKPLFAINISEDSLGAVCEITAWNPWEIAQVYNPTPAQTMQAIFDEARV